MEGKLRNLAAGMLALLLGSVSQAKEMTFRPLGVDDLVGCWHSAFDGRGSGESICFERNGKATYSAFFGAGSDAAHGLDDEGTYSLTKTKLLLQIDQFAGFDTTASCDAFILRNRLRIINCTAPGDDSPVADSEFKRVERK